MPQAKRPAAKPAKPSTPAATAPPAEDPELDGELTDDEPGDPPSPANPEEVELLERDDADEDYTVLTRSQVYELVYQAVGAGTGVVMALPEGKDIVMPTEAAGAAAAALIDELVTFQEPQEGEPVPSRAAIIAPLRGDYRSAVAVYLAEARQADIRPPAQALAAAASRAEEAVTAGLAGAADLIVVAVEPGRGREAQGHVELALGLAPLPEPVQD